jgi:hypothetical protein
MYGGWFGTLLCIVLALATTGQSAKRRVVGLSSCRPVANDIRQTSRCRSRVVAMSHCRSIQIERLAYKPNDRATSRQLASRQRAVWRASLETRRQRFVVLSIATRRKDDNAQCNKSATISMPSSIRYSLITNFEFSLKTMNGFVQIEQWTSPFQIFSWIRVDLPTSTILQLYNFCNGFNK